MKLTREGIKDLESFKQARISLPSYDIRAAEQKALKAPRWAHFGIGNIFRIFIGGIADELLEKGMLDRGLTCIETYDDEVVDKVYTPCDNLALSVILGGDGRRMLRVLGSFAETVKAENMDRIREVFRSPDLQLVSFTITEKGYVLTDQNGEYLPDVLNALDNGPRNPQGAMAVLTAGLMARSEAGKLPLALVSMDNCAKNGRLLKASVCRVAGEWAARGFAPEGFPDWLEEEADIAFDSTMIDKITPRPSPAIAADLEQLGLEDMQPLVTARQTYIAPFVNGEGPQYLVIEDRFPNGRPALENGSGVYMGDFDTVNRAERMKVTALLNPVHSATGPIGVVLGDEYFAVMLRERPIMLALARKVAYDEGMAFTPDPGILSPKAFADELFTERFPNLYLGDTNLRLSTDVSQGVSVRFGETIKACKARFGSAAQLTGIALGIAGWLRYMLAVDDAGRPYELAPDPMNEEITQLFSGIRFGHPETVGNKLKGILARTGLFGTDLYEAGIGDKIEAYFRQMLSGPGAVLSTVTQAIGE